MIFQLNRETYLDADKTLADRVKKYYVTKWYCTDIYAGSRLLTFDGIPVFFTWQTGRKCDREYYSLNDEKAEEMMKFLESLCIKEEYKYIKSALGEDLSPCFDEEMQYSVEFTGQLLKNSGYYQGKKVEVDEEKTNELERADSFGICQEMIVKVNGDGVKIPVNEFRMTIYE